MSAAGVSVVPPFIGTYFNTMLYSLELVGVYIYFFRDRRSKDDPKLIKYALLLSLLSDTLGTIASIAMIYIFTLVFPTMNPPSITRLYWPFELWISTNMISATVFQCYMVIRYFRLAGNWALTLIIFLLIGTSFGSTVHLLAIYQTVIPALFSSEASSFFAARFIVLVLTTAMTTDILIAVALIWQLRSQEVYSTHTRGLVHRISSQTVKTGTIPCLFAMVVLITYLAYKDGSVSVCFAFMLGRVYTLTMIFTLIFRDDLLRPSVDGSMPGVMFIDAEKLGGPSNSMNGTHNHNGVSISSQVDGTVVGENSPNTKSKMLHGVRSSGVFGVSPGKDSILSSGTQDTAGGHPDVHDPKVEEAQESGATNVN